MLHINIDGVVKAQLSERERLERLLSKQEASIQAAFVIFLAEVRSPEILREARLLLEDRNIEGALRLVDSYIIRLGGVITSVFQDVGAEEASAMTNQFQVGLAGVAISFDPTNPRAAELMRRSRLTFVRELTRSQREVTRQAVVESLQEGLGSTQTSRLFRDSIGLTQFQRNAVNNYKRLLQLGSREALDRVLRDRRFDPTVERAIDSGEPLSAGQINRMVQRYRQRFIQLRAETIARTESLRVVGEARQESLEQNLEQTGIPPDKVTRIWQATRDERTRDTHRVMHGQRRGLREPFQSPSGARLRFPGDSSAPAAEVINCRCVLVHEIEEGFF